MGNLFIIQKEDRGRWAIKYEKEYSK